MPRILLLSATTGYQLRSFAAAALRQGIEFVLATDRCHILENPWGDSALAVRCDEPEESAAQIQAVTIPAVTGIVAVADKPTLIAALVAERWGIPWHPPKAARVCRDKNAMRRAFEGAGLPVPQYALATSEADAGSAGYPCVLKPLGLSGSRGVIRADTPAEFVAAFARIQRLAEGPLQVESYIPGREFALEGIMTNGRLQTLAVFDKPDPLEGPFFEETLYVTPSREAAATQQQMIETTMRAATALGLRHGPVHAEMRVNEQGVYMLEIAARPIGGLCARALRFHAGGHEETLTLEDLVVLHAVGRMPETLAPAVAASGVMMIPVPRAGVLEAVSGVEDARQIAGIDDVIVTAKPGERLVPLPEGASYTGFLFASGADAAFVEQALRQAHRALRFDILSALEVLG